MNIDNPSITIAYKNCRPLISAINKKMANIEKLLGIDPRDVDAIDPMSDAEYRDLHHGMFLVSEAAKEFYMSDKADQLWDHRLDEPSAEMLSTKLTIAMPLPQYALLSTMAANITD